jgi:deoxyribodipyrimidine photo-lyase
MATQLVWLKRDLRITDHAPLVQAANAGPCGVLFVFEPEWLHSPECDPSHVRFVLDSLKDVQASLQKLGGDLHVATGSMPEVLDRLFETTPFEVLWSHEETGNNWTYQRDLRVAAWARRKGVRWVEVTQHGVVRRLKNRDGWAAKWEARMTQPQWPEPVRIVSALPGTPLPNLTELGVSPSTKPQAQPGGWQAAQHTLEGFLRVRGEDYQSAMSSPNSAWSACSRLSPHIAWGTVSMRQVVQATRLRLKEPLTGLWARSLRSFEKRLHWHCHFIQKLEDEPAIEFENMNRGFDGLREDDFNEDLFQAYCTAQTGYPFVDACLRCLFATGWLNFRMRAMLASFAAYQLWLHWRRPAVFLARHFLDFEPGIHFSQFQMQSGVTGINTLRIYSPIKQSLDQDPDGVFIRRWVPELAALPTEYVHQPETLPPLLALSLGFQPGVSYPLPVVEPVGAYRQAKERIYAWKQRPEVRHLAHAVYEKHGSRKR